MSQPNAKKSMKNTKWVGGEEPTGSSEGTSFSNTVYLLFAYLFIICIFCLFNSTVQNDKIERNLESMGYILLIFFEILLFGFLFWKLFFGGNGYTTKGFYLSEYIAKLTNSENITTPYSNAVMYSVGVIAFIYFLEIIIYMARNQNSAEGMSTKLLLFFAFLTISTLFGILYGNITVPLYIILCIGIVLIVVSSILANIALWSVPKDTNIIPASADLLRIYKILTVTTISIVLALIVILFTPNFKLSFADAESLTSYKINNGVVLLLSVGLLALSSYNIYNTNTLMMDVNNWKKWL